MDPFAGSPAAGKSVAGIINLFVDDLFGTSEIEMEHRVPSRLRKDFQVGSEDWNDVALTGQRIRWTQDSPKGRTLNSVKTRPLMSWRKSLWNEERTEAYWDR